MPDRVGVAERCKSGCTGAAKRARIATTGGAGQDESDAHSEHRCSDTSSGRDSDTFYATPGGPAVEPEVCVAVDLFEVIAELAGLDLDERARGGRGHAPRRSRRSRRPRPRTGAAPARGSSARAEQRREASIARSMDSARGQLLIAGPTLLDPNFWRTVVLVVEHTEDGALGLVLNRPSETTVGEAVPQLEQLVDPDEQLFIGGPVQPSSVIVLGRVRGPRRRRADRVRRRRRARRRRRPEEHGAGRAPRPRVRRPRRLGPRPARRRARARRLDPRAGAAARTRSPAEPTDLWAAVLTRKGGSYALIARMPPDPSVN